MTWNKNKPAGTDDPGTIDDSCIANFSALDTWANALTDGIAAGAATVVRVYRSSNVVIAALRAAATDTVDRFRLDLNGGMAWGSGSAAMGRAWTGPRMVRVKKSADQNTNEVEATITWGQEDFDTDNMHDNVTNNERLTAPVAGKYLAVLNVVATTTGGTNAIFRIKNDTGALQAQGVTTGLMGGLSLSVPVSLAAAGYVYATFRTVASGQSANIESATLANFSLVYLGE